MLKCKKMIVMHNELSKKIKAYFSNKKEVIAVYLFGSYAEARECPFSDIDIGLLLDRMDHKNIKDVKNKFIIELSRILRKDMHLVILNSASEELIRQIFLKGKCILVSDPKKTSRYKMVMLAKVTEFLYYRTQMQAGLIKKVMGD
jgi:hypothetical protein